MPTVKELGEKLNAKRLAMKGIVEEAGGFDVLDFSKVTSLGEGDAKAKLEKFQQMNAELKDVNDEYEMVRVAEKAARDNEAGLKEMNRVVNALGNPYHEEDGEKGGRKGPDTLGEWIAESEAFKGYDPQASGRGGGLVGLRAGSDGKGTGTPIDMKTLMTSTGGFVVQSPVATKVVPINQRRLVVADLIPQDTVTDKLVTWMEETTFTNAAAPVAEGDAKPESALAWTRREATMKKIATHIPVTTEQIMYVPSFVSIVNGRMVVMLKLTEEDQLIDGSGSGANLLGFLNKPGILTRAKDTDNNVDAIFKMFTDIQTGTAFAEPSGVILHPTNWQTIRLMKTLDEAYLWGPPSESGEERVWGKPVVKTPAIDAGTALTGDFQLYSHISRFGGIRFEVGMINAQFIENEKTLLIEEFISLEIYNAAAFGTVTGLN